VKLIGNRPLILKNSFPRKIKPFSYLKYLSNIFLNGIYVCLGISHDVGVKIRISGDSTFFIFNGLGR